MTEFPPAHNPFHLTSEGSEVYGGIYSAQGPEAHGLFIMSPEIGGYDRLTSLFNPIMMAGINVLYFFPRGMWDQTETYTQAGHLQDLKNIIAHVKSPEVAAKYRIDPERIAMGGLSGGGGVLSMIAAAEDPTLSYAMAVAPGNVEQLRAGLGAMTPRAEELRLGSNGRIDSAPIRDELLGGLIDRVSIIGRAGEFVDKTILLVNGSRDELSPVELHFQPIVDALRAAGVANLTDVILDGNHLLLTKRDELAAVVISWLRDQCGF